MELKKGYKRTEIGAIPSDWKLLAMDDVMTFSGGSQPPRDTFIYKKREGYVRLLQIRDYKTDKYKTFIPEELGRKFCSDDDIMIGRYGPPIFQILNGLKGAYNVALIKAIPKLNLNKLYAYYFLKQEKLFQFVEKLSQRSSGQTGVDLVELKKYPFPLPPLPEQKAIAQVLTDTDQLIQALEQKITKKRAIKQGAMQELLKPKEGWVVRKLGENCEMYSGGTPDTTVAEYYNGTISWIASGDLNKKFIREVSGRISEKGYVSSSAKMVEPDTLLIAMYGATAGVSAISKIQGAINQAVLAIITQKNINTLFLFYNFQLRKDWLIDTYTQGGQPNLSGGIIKSIEFSFPSIIEQTRIATILSDMDKEIAQLEAKHNKYKQVKQGLMQNLLTGKIRLL